MKFLRSFFSYVPAEFPEVPKEELPDPNEERNLSDSYRAARRSLVAICGLSLGWSTAQFTPSNLQLAIGGMSLDLGNASVPLIIAAVLLYLTARWMLEFAMMPRHIRRWRLAQLDFRFILNVTKFSLLMLAAASLERSIKIAAVVIASLMAITFVSLILGILLMFVTIPIRMWARSRAHARISAANSVGEGLAWAIFFSICLTAVGILSFAIASYHEPLRSAFWGSPPDPLALSTFIATLVLVFLSPLMLNHTISRLFAERPTYYTERGPNGELRITFFKQEREPIL